MKELLNHAAAACVEYRSNIGERSVAPTPQAIAQLKSFDEPLPVKSSTAFEVFDKLHQFGSPATMGSSGGRYFGFVIGGSLPVSLAANWLVSSWDQNGGLVVTSPVAAHFEAIASCWLCELLPVSKDAAVGFVTGVTMANFCGIVAARHALLKRQGWDVESQGLFGAPSLQVIVGDEVHGSLLKALSLAGLGRDRVHRVPVDDQGRMRIDAFPENINENTLVCLQAGNVDTGSFDPASEIIPFAKNRGAWVHVDGAFGLWAGASVKYHHLTKGVEAADSWATDGHKWLNVPYDCGMIFCRDAGHLRASMAMSGAYLDQSGMRVPYQYTPELSRRARGIEVWAALRMLGRQGVAEIIERTCRHAQRFATGLRKAGFDILNDVVLNQVLVSFGDAATTQKVIAGIQQEGTCWCGGSTVWQGKTAMRISIVSCATTDEDVEKSLEAIITIGQANTRRK